MKKTITALLIIALVSLFTILVAGCEEEQQLGTSIGETQNRTAETQDAATPDTGKASERNSEEATGGESTTGEVDITLYFADEQAEYLVPEVRRVTAGADIARAAVEELVKGPKESGHNATIPSETRVLGVEVEENTAYVNLSQDLIDKHWGGSTGELMTITSIVNTLTGLGAIKEVQILVEGKVVETIAGHADISKPLGRDETIIKK